jgi:outer membrane protein TolC
MNRPLLVALAALAGAPAAAQDPPDSPPALRLSVEEARARARATAPSLEQARALERAARAEVDRARAAERPQVEVLGSYTRQSHVPELVIPAPDGSPFPIFPDIPDNGRARVSGAWSVYSGGRFSSLAAAARSEAAAAERDAAAFEADLLLETTDAYWALVTARESERVVTESLAAYEAHLADARNRFAAGLAARNEVLAVQVERDRAELSRLRAANAAEIAAADLRRLVGAPAGTRLETTEPLADAESLPPGAEEGTASGALVADALARRPERLALAERILAAEAQTAAEKAVSRPQVTLAGGFEFANPNRRIVPVRATWQEAWDVTLNLSWSLFDGGRTAAAARAAAARAEALRRQSEDLDQRIALQVTARALDLGAARRAVEVAGRNLEAARENSRVAAERHRAGVIPSSERLDAEVLLLRAALDHTQAQAQLRTARAALDRARGR